MLTLKTRNEWGQTPLHEAAQSNGNPEVITALLEAGADPQAQDESGRTPGSLLEENDQLKDTDIYGRFEPRAVMVARTYLRIGRNHEM